METHLNQVRRVEPSRVEWVGVEMHHMQHTGEDSITSTSQIQVVNTQSEGLFLSHTFYTVTVSLL